MLIPLGFAWTLSHIIMHPNGAVLGMRCSYGHQLDGTARWWCCGEGSGVDPWRNLEVGKSSIIIWLPVTTRRESLRSVLCSLTRGGATPTYITKLLAWLILLVSQQQTLKCIHRFVGFSIHVLVPLTHFSKYIHNKVQDSSRWAVIEAQDAWLRSEGRYIIRRAVLNPFQSSVQVGWGVRFPGLVLSTVQVEIRSIWAKL